MRYLHGDKVTRLQRAAMARGGTMSAPGFVHWNIAGKCEKPVWVELRSRQDRDKVGHVNHTNDGWVATPEPGRAVTMEAECRKCATCLRKRMWRWAYRAKAEISAAHRTWFITLTFNPTLHMRALNECRAELIRNGLDFDGLGEEEQYHMRQGNLSKYVTKFLKRLRERSQARVRYLLVAERHQSGAPHYHCLLHHSADTAVTYRDIEASWGHGFMHAKLVADDDTKAAWYVCKYIGKSSDARVRASAEYGNG